MIVLIILTAWFALGFLAAWLDHKYVYGSSLDTSFGLAFLIASGGPVMLVIVGFICLRNKYEWTFVLFRARK